MGDLSPKWDCGLPQISSRLSPKRNRSLERRTRYVHLTRYHLFSPFFFQVAYHKPSGRRETHRRKILFPDLSYCTRIYVHIVVLLCFVLKFPLAPGPTESHRVLRKTSFVKTPPLGRCFRVFSKPRGATHNVAGGFRKLRTICFHR